MQMSDATLTTAPMRELAAVVFSMKKTILAALLIPPIIAAALVFVLPPVYRAEVQLLVKTGREFLPSSVGDSSVSAPTSTKQEDINSEIELLNSRALAEEVINTIGLKNLFPGLVENPPWFGTVMDAAIKTFQHHLDVAPVKLSNIINVTYDAEDPAEATRVLDTFIRVYLTKHTQVYATGRKQGYEEVIGREMAEMARLEQEKGRIKLENQIYDITPQRAALIQQRVDAQTHLQEAIDRKSTLEQRIAALTSAQATVPATVKTTETDHSYQMDHARDALTDLRQTEAALSARYAPNNPELVRIRAQIAALQSHSRGLGEGVKVTTAPAQLAQQVEQELVMDRVELAPLDGEIVRYKSLIEGYSRELDRLERADTQLRLNQSQIDDLQSNITALRLRLDQARTEETLDHARMLSVVQIAPAIAPDKPAFPRPVIFVAVGLIFGILASIGTIVLAIMTRRTFYTAIGLERQLGIPVLASVDMVPGKGAPRALLLE
ncbi:MAG: hypothetical protein JSR21_05185 [Proteobacteria bacterium]|nr:hypothetical protein [Pseudomonadota bacterium]